MFKYVVETVETYCFLPFILKKNSFRIAPMDATQGCTHDREVGPMPIEDEVIHWWKDDKGEQHRTILRLESEAPTSSNGFPRDGLVTVRVMNTVGQAAIKLSPDEALRMSSQLVSISKEMLNKKRKMWRERE